MNRSNPNVRRVAGSLAIMLMVITGGFIGAECFSLSALPSEKFNQILIFLSSLNMATFGFYFGASESQQAAPQRAPQRATDVQPQPERTQQQ